MTEEKPTSLEELFDPSKVRYLKSPPVQKVMWIANRPKDLTKGDWLSILGELKRVVGLLEHHAKDYDPDSPTDLQVQDEKDHAYKMYVLLDLLKKRYTDADFTLY